MATGRLREKMMGGKETFSKLIKLRPLRGQKVEKEGEHGNRGATSFEGPYHSKSKKKKKRLEGETRYTNK